MHIGFISTEIFAWGKYGGFGKATRMLGRELVKRGYQVSVLIPRRSTQRQIEELDGMRVYGYNVWKPQEVVRIFEECEADIFHSQEPNMGTYLAQRYHPEKKHIVTFRDTRLFSDWLIEFALPSKNRAQVMANILFEDNLLVHKAVRNADARFSASYLLIDRALHKYRLKEKPSFLPTPVEIPTTSEKDGKPTVCYISRWDRRKRPELFIELARSFPAVQFIAAGASRNSQYDQKIRSQLLRLPNVEVHGVIDQFSSNELATIFSRSWILVNTSARESLPNSFIEACGARCAILSSVDPDGFASKYGFFVKDDDFITGLNELLSNMNWRQLGCSGYDYVKKIFAVDKSIERHINIYETIYNVK